jgi:hypothetical protein
MANKKEVMVYPQSFSTGEKAIARQNIGAGTANVHIITTDYSNPTLGDAAFAELESAVNDNEEVLIIVGMTNAAIYYKLAAVSSSGYRFESYTSSGLSTLTINRTTKSKTFNTEILGLPTVTHYAASWGAAWNTLRRLTDDILSNTILATVTLSTPITLNANKRYMIIPEGITGSVEQTKTVAHTTDNAYNICMWLSDSTKIIYYGKTAVTMASAEIANYSKLSLEYPPVGGTYIAAFNSYPSIIEPEDDLSMDTLSIMNTGNISWGFDSDHPALLAFHNRITGICVMEIK